MRRRKVGDRIPGRIARVAHVRTVRRDGRTFVVYLLTDSLRGPRRSRVTVELPCNVKFGQVRRTVGIVSQAEWHGLSGDEQAAADALALHVWWRCRQKQHPAFEGDVFLSNGWVRGLLRAAGARKTGENAARAALQTMTARGRPRRPQASVDQAERFQPAGRVELEGGRDAQPTLRRSYWWRVLPALTAVVKALRPSGAYGHHGDASPLSVSW